jgi:hypothetical protein
MTKLIDPSDDLYESPTCRLQQCLLSTLLAVLIKQYLVHMCTHICTFATRLFFLNYQESRLSLQKRTLIACARAILYVLLDGSIENAKIGALTKRQHYHGISPYFHFFGFPFALYQ